METEDITPILEKIREKSGIDFCQYREGTLRRRVSRRASANNCPDMAAYLAILDSNPSEYVCLLSDLSIKYTEFFRDPKVFDTIRDRVLPGILNDKSKLNDTLAIWSAGCATGQEAYSIASLIRQMARHESCPNVSILGTDIDPAAITAAEAGCYVKALLPTMPDGGAVEHFSDDGTRILVSPALRDMVRFCVHDITAESAIEAMREIWPGRFDLILCRNVLIYLHRSAQARVVTTCLELLNPGGFLILGTGETMPGSLEHRVTVFDTQSRIYRNEPLGNRRSDARC